jgi:hypothetical protein
MLPILSVLGSIATGLFGGGSGGSNQNVVTTLADKILPQTAKEKAAAAIAGVESDIKDVESARAYNPPDIGITQYQPGMGLIPWMTVWILDVIGRVTDATNHLLRPAMMVWIIGGFMKQWSLPNPGEIDPQLWTVFMIMVTFWFGARTLVKDIPAVWTAIKSMKK